MPASFVNTLPLAERDWAAKFFETQLWAEWAQARLQRNDDEQLLGAPKK